MWERSENTDRNYLSPGNGPYLFPRSMVGIKPCSKKLITFRCTRSNASQFAGCRRSVPDYVSHHRAAIGHPQQLAGSLSHLPDWNTSQKRTLKCPHHAYTTATYINNSSITLTDFLWTKRAFVGAHYRRQICLRRLQTNPNVVVPCAWHVGSLFCPTVFIF